MAEEAKALPFPLGELAKMSPRQKVASMFATAMFVALLVGGLMWAQEPGYSVLFSNLSDRDGGQITTALQQQNVPYKMSDSGTAILVPSTMVHDIRLRLASQGLPKGGLVGFEVMENQRLGISQFAEQINYQRALEGELARSIQSLAAVQASRVHLAIPKQTAFLRDEQKPSASVLVNLHPGRVLEPSQVAGIVHLVSSSVPQLNPANVSVVDQDGNLISQKTDPLRNAGLDASQIKFVRELEASYIKRVEAILGAVVGTGNVRAQVTADVDFSQTEQVAETYRPNPTPDTAVRSQQTAESGTPNPNAVGVPGALTNQPPVPATAPITTPPVPGSTLFSMNAEKLLNYTRNATINYEVDKTVRHTKGVPGTIRRLSVAVVVNHKKDPGKPKPTPLTPAELKQVTDLAREAIGFSAQRGDTLNVANAPFAPPEQEILPETPIWKDPELMAMLKDAARYLPYLLLVYLIWVKVMKPLYAAWLAAVRRREEEEEQKRLKALDEARRADARGGRLSYEEKLESAKNMAKSEPKAVAGVIKDWVEGAGG